MICGTGRPIVYVFWFAQFMGFDLWVVVVFFGGNAGLGDRDSNRLVTNT